MTQKAAKREQIEEQEKITTIKLPVSLKGDLDTEKADAQESYAGVIERLIAFRKSLAAGKAVVAEGTVQEINGDTATLLLKDGTTTTARILGGEPPYPDGEEAPPAVPDDTITLTIPRKVFQFMMMVVPDNLRNALRKGVQ